MMVLLDAVDGSVDGGWIFALFFFEEERYGNQ